MSRVNFFDYINITQYRSLICLNGELPDEWFFAQNAHLPVIAVDGAANKLSDRQIKYEMIVGDLDSAAPDLLASCACVVHLPSQDSSDFQKTVAYLKELQLLPSIILGINGGYIDHILHNINIFSKLDCIFFAPPIIGKVIRSDEVQRWTLPVMSKISLIALPSAVVTSSGLKWELDNVELSFFGGSSCFNRIIQRDVRIEVESGEVLVLIYTEDMIDAGSHNIT